MKCVDLTLLLSMDCTDVHLLAIARFWVCAWGFTSGVIVYIIDFFKIGKTVKA